MFTIKENVLFDSLPKEKQEILRRIGFTDGDNISEICKDILSRKNKNLDYYFFENSIYFQKNLSNFLRSQVDTILELYNYFSKEQFNIIDSFIHDEQDNEVFVEECSSSLPVWKTHIKDSDLSGFNFKDSELTSLKYGKQKIEIGEREYA